jgi:hypothetical protein
MRSVGLAQILAMLLLPSASALGGTIRMTISTSAEHRDGALDVDLTISNGGNEDASAVVPVITCHGRSERAKGARTLTPGGKATERIRLATGTIKEGRWPCRVEVSYSDANGFPFQAVHAFLFEVGSPPPARVLLDLTSVEALDDSTDTTIPVRNLDAIAHSVRVESFVSGSLSASITPPELQVPPNSDRNVSLHLVNRRAKIGSRLPVVVTMEYESAGYHHAAVVSTTVTVIAPPPFLTRYRLALMSVGGLLALVGLVFAVIRRAKLKARS